MGVESGFLGKIHPRLDSILKLCQTFPIDTFSGLLSGHMKVRIHDEAYVRVHLGILSLNLDFLVARACFKGGTEYNIDILKVYYN